MPDDSASASVFTPITVTISQVQYLEYQALQLERHGSGFGTEALKILEKIISEGREPNGGEFEILDDLIDSGLDDLEGPALRIDLSKDKVY